MDSDVRAGSSPARGTMGQKFQKEEILEIIKSMNPKLNNYLGLKIISIIKRKNTHLIKYEWVGDISSMIFRNSMRSIRSGFDSIEVDDLLNRIREYKLKRII